MLNTPKIGVSLAILALATALPCHPAPPTTEGWQQSLEAARETARQDGKLIVVDLWADWCTWCKKLDEEVFTSDVFREWAADYVLLRVNTEDGAEGTRLQEDFGVSGLPTTLIITPDMVRVGQLQGFSPAPTYIQNLDLERAMFAMLVRVHADVDEATGSETLRTLANDFHERRDGARAASMFERLRHRGEETVDEVAWNRYYHADALADARTSAIETGNKDVRELVDLLPYHIARDREACADAESALDAYLHEHPDGVYIDIAQEALVEIRETRQCA